MFRPVFFIGALCLLGISVQARPKTQCIGKAADIMFVMDSSSSVWSVDYKKQLKFVADLVEGFDVGKGRSQVRVGAITFSDRAYLEFPPDRYTDPAELKEAILNIAYRTGRTNTADALTLLREQVEPNLKNRKGPIVAVIITDGRSTKPKETIKEAKKLHELGINVYAIGVGHSREYDIGELKAIASDPDNGVYTVSSYSALKGITQKFHIKPCKVIPTTTAEPTTTPAPTTTTLPPTTPPTTTLPPTTPPTTTLPPTTPPTTTRRTTTRRVTERPECIGKAADIMFVMDSSSSVWSVDYKKQLKFVADLVEGFDVGKGRSQVRVGAITFSDRAYLEFPPDRYTDPAELKEAILNIAYRTGRTNTADALTLLREQVEPNLKNRKGPIVAVIITDGRSTKPKETIKEAKKLHELGINVYAIGVGHSREYDIEELKAIASDNGVYTVSSYSDLKEITQKFHIKPCKVIPTTTAEPTTTPAPTTTTLPPTTPPTTTLPPTTPPTTTLPPTTPPTTTLPPTTLPTTTLPPTTPPTTTLPPTTPPTTTRRTTTRRVTERPVQTKPVERDPSSIIIFGFDVFTMGHYRTPIIHQFIDTFLPLSGYGRFSISSIAYCPDTFNIPIRSLMNRDPLSMRHTIDVGARLPGLSDVVHQMQRDMASNVVHNPITGRPGNQVAVLFIDPHVTVISQELINATNELKQQGVKLFLINVGQNTWHQAYDLRTISSQPYNSHTFNYPTYDQLLYSVRTPFRFRTMCNQYVTPPSLIKHIKRNN